MVNLRCTRKLLTRLGCGGETPSAESTTRLGDWYGNIFRIGHRQPLIFISERFCLPVIVPSLDAKRLAGVFSEAVCAVLAAAGVCAADIADVRWRMSDLAFGPTKNRSVLGTLNDFAAMAKATDARRSELEPTEELMRFLAQAPT